MNSKPLPPLPARVQVLLKGTNFGPTTSDFGMALIVYIGKNRHLTYSWGRGGNNSKERFRATVDIPDDFHTKGPAAQAQTILFQLETAGANTMYRTSPGTKAFGASSPLTYSNAVGDDCERIYIEIPDGPF